MMTNHIDPTDEIGCEELPGFQDHEDELMELGALGLFLLHDLDHDDVDPDVVDPAGTPNL